MRIAYAIGRRQREKASLETPLRRCPGTREAEGAGVRPLPGGRQERRRHHGQRHADAHRPRHVFRSLRIGSRGVLAGSAGDAAAWMCARAAQVECRDRRAVLGTAKDRAHREQLVERRLAVQDVASGEPVGGLEIARRDDLPMDDEPFDVRCVFRQRAQNHPSELVRRIGPRPAAGEGVGRVLHVDRHHVRARRRERRIVERGEHDVEVRRGRDLTVLRGVEGALQVVDAGADLHAALQVGGAADAAKRRQGAQSEIHFRRRSRAAIVSHPYEEAGIELDRIDESEEGVLRIDARNDRARADLAAIVEHDAGRAAVTHEHLGDGRVSADLGTRLRRRVSHGARQRARSALDGHAAAARRGIDCRVQEQRRARAGGPGTLRRRRRCRAPRPRPARDRS